MDCPYENPKDNGQTQLTNLIGTIAEHELDENFTSLGIYVTKCHDIGTFGMISIL